MTKSLIAFAVIVIFLLGFVWGAVFLACLTVKNAQLEKDEEGFKRDRGGRSDTE